MEEQLAIIADNLTYINESIRVLSDQVFWCAVWLFFLLFFKEMK